MGMMTRRGLLKNLLAGTAGWFLAHPLARTALGMGDASLLRLGVLRYEGNWNSRPNAPRTVLEELQQRTSVLAWPEPVVVAADEQAIFRCPFLWITGDQEMSPISEQAVENLRRHLTFGGTLFADDTSGAADSAFSRALRRELGRVCPTRQFEPLPHDHAVFRAYYFLSKAVGLRVVEPRLEGITMEERAVVIFSPNDLSGALERDAGGQWRLEMDSKEPEDRTLAQRLAVNLVIYATTVNYKLDQVHISYRLRHPALYPEAPPAGAP
jgi:hypothetical protein